MITQEVRRICVSGTSSAFSSTASPDASVPLFYKHFDPKFFHLASVVSNSHFLIAFNHMPKLYRGFIKSGGTRKHAILIRLEPDSVFPAQYGSRITDKYGLVLSPGSSRQILENQVQLGWPYQYHLNPANPTEMDPSLIDILSTENYQDLFDLNYWRKRTHLLTMVAGNKVSAVSNANYALRRKLARYLPVESLEVYGPLWDGSIYQKARHRLAVFVATLKQGSIPNIREIYGDLFSKYATAKGSIANKHDLLRDSKFSLVIENSNTIVTEKIFDAVINGAIPLYVGPDLRDIGLPVDIAIPISGSSEEILEILGSLDAVTVEKYLVAMSDFIDSPNFRENWAADIVYRNLALQTIDYINGVN